MPIITPDRSAAQVSQTRVHLCDERGTGRAFEQEDYHSVVQGTWIVPVGRTQEWRRVGAAITIAIPGCHCKRPL